MPRTAPGAGDDRTITATGLARLLTRLDSDPDQAAREYERLRRTLVRFFDWRGAWPPEECADVTIDRLARRLEEDTPIEDVRQYALGIARLVLLERQRRGTNAPVESRDDMHWIPAPAQPEHDPLLDCFDRCLSETPSDDRSLLLAYYQGERAAKIANRRRLAARLGVSDNALRSRMRRLRERIEQCVGDCLSRTS
jgi:DNA-directed RNA polymerase specialized sigma24 family protein